MIKVFIPTDKKVKSKVRGLWVNDKGKIYYDYLRIEKAEFNDLKLLQEDYNQEALFYISGNNRTKKIGCIYNKGDIGLLEHRIYAEIKSLRAEIKEALKLYGGVTIYKKGNKYFKEVFYK